MPAIAEREPAHSIDNEVCTLGSLLLARDISKAVATCNSIIEVKDFYRPVHQIIYLAIMDMVSAGTPVNLVSLPDKLKAMGQLDAVGGIDYIVGIAEGVPDAANIEYHCREVKEQSRKRDVTALAQRLLDASKDPTHTADDLRHILVEHTERDVPQRPDPTRPSPLSIDAIIEQYPDRRRPIIDGLIRRGEVANLISSSKSFKSWTLMHWALMLAQGQTIYGFATEPSRVLMLDFELERGTLAHRFKVVRERVGCGDIGDAVMIEPLRGRSMNVRGLAKYLSHFKPGDFDLVIVDPLFKLMLEGSDENSNVQMASLYAELIACSERMDAGVIVVHHTTKGDQSEKSVTDLGAGGGSQARAADAHLALREHSQPGCAVLSGVVRSFAPLTPVGLRWNFPIWEVDSTIDVDDLKKPARGGKKKEPAVAPWEKRVPTGPTYVQG